MQYVMELYLALAESVNYLGLSGVQGFARPYKGEEKVPIVLLFRAYDFFQDVVESAFDSLTALMVDISLNDEELALRIVLDTSSEEAITPVIGSYSDAKLISDEDGIIAIISLREGGAV